MEMKGTLTNHTIGRYGRFANGIYQIMGLIGIAREQGFDWAVPRWVNWDHRERFNSTEDVDIYKHLAHEMPEVSNVNWPERHYGWGWHQVILPAGNQSITGHFQSPKYFENAMTEIRHFLTFRDEPAQSNQVAVHVRRGDYDPQWHVHLGMDYYTEAMSRFPVGTEFLLFSDDLPAAQEMFKEAATQYQITLFPGTDYIQDFKKMKSCHSFIIANSSYSAAAATLANQPGKRVIAPRAWFGPAWGDGHREMSKDIYQSTWEII